MNIFSMWLDWLPKLLDGFVVSLQVAALSVLFGIPLGLIFALASNSKKPYARIISVLLVEMGRGGPVLILLQFLYFGLPSSGLTLSSFVASVVALAWSTGAYTSEIIKAGINAVPRGQTEAAKTLGLSGTDTLKLIVIPQGLRIALPPLLGFCLLVLQATSLCFTIALPELVAMANEIGSQTFRYMPVMVLTGIIFAAVCIPATLLVERFEQHLARHEL